MGARRDEESAPPCDSDDGVVVAVLDRRQLDLPPRSLLLGAMLLAWLLRQVEGSRYVARCARVIDSTTGRALVRRSVGESRRGRALELDRPTPAAQQSSCPSSIAHGSCATHQPENR
jgi:hypothetical protein